MRAVVPNSEPGGGASLGQPATYTTTRAIAARISDRASRDRQPGGLERADERGRAIDIGDTLRTKDVLVTPSSGVRPRINQGGGRTYQMRWTTSYDHSREHVPREVIYWNRSGRINGRVPISYKMAFAELAAHLGGAK